MIARSGAELVYLALPRMGRTGHLDTYLGTLTGSNLPEKDVREALQAMAGLLRTTNETMAQLQRQVRLLEKVTPAQATEINRAIRGRATEICAIYMIRDDRAEKLAAAAIRKAVKLQFGAGAVKEIPRCDFEIALEQVQGWDDYKVMKDIGKKVKT